jgi:hypothetical protein
MHILTKCCFFCWKEAWQKLLCCFISLLCDQHARGLSRRQFLVLEPDLISLIKIAEHDRYRYWSYWSDRLGRYLFDLSNFMPIWSDFLGSALKTRFGQVDWRWGYVILERQICLCIWRHELLRYWDFNVSLLSPAIKHPVTILVFRLKGISSFEEADLVDLDLCLVYLSHNLRRFADCPLAILHLYSVD